MESGEQGHASAPPTSHLQISLVGDWDICPPSEPKVPHMQDLASRITHFQELVQQISEQYEALHSENISLCAQLKVAASVTSPPLSPRSPRLPNRSSIQSIQARGAERTPPECSSQADKAQPTKWSSHGDRAQADGAKPEKNALYSYSGSRLSTLSSHTASGTAKIGTIPSSSRIWSSTRTSLSCAPPVEGPRPSTQSKATVGGGSSSNMFRRARTSSLRSSLYSSQAHPRVDRLVGTGHSDTERGEGARSRNQRRWPTWYNPEQVDITEAKTKAELWVQQEEAGSHPVAKDRFVVSPLGWVRLLWDAIWCIALMYDLWITPLQLIFLSDFGRLPPAAEVLSIISMCFFFMDIVFNFFTGYVDGADPQIVLQRSRIVRNYLRRWFLFDLFVTTPWDLIFAWTDSASSLRAARAAKISKAMKILKLIKLLRFAKVLQHTKTVRYLIDQMTYERSGIWFLASRLLYPMQILFVLFVNAHFYGCIWAALQMGWAASPDFAGAALKYYQSFWWAYSVLCFGNYPSATLPEVWTLELVLLVTRLLLVFIGTRMLASQNWFSHEHDTGQAKVGGLLQYLSERDVTAELQAQVASTSKAVRQAKRENRTMQTMLMSELPASLLRRISEELWVPKLMTLGLIMQVGSWDDQVVSELAMVVTEELYAPHVIIFKEGDCATAAYLVLKGEVAVFSSSFENPQDVPPFKSGMWLSEKSLLGVGLRRSGMARTRTATRLLVVPSAEFMGLLDTFDLRIRFETFCSNELWRGLCGRCGLLGDHFGDDCPIMRARRDSGMIQLFSLPRRLWRIEDSTPVAPRGSMSRDLKLYLKEKKLVRLTDALARTGCTHLDDVKDVDLGTLERRLSDGGAEGLSAHEYLFLQRKSVMSFMEVHGDDFAKAKDNQVCAQYVFFLSHYKVEAGTEAALMRTELEVLIREDCSIQDTDSLVFLDSEDLMTLESLKEQVMSSQYLAILLTTHVLERPWVLVEAVTAIRNHVPVVLVELQKQGNAFEYPDETFYQSLLDGSHLGQEGTKMLKSQDIELSDVADTLRAIFQRIAVPYSPHRPEVIRRAELQTLLRQCQCCCRTESKTPRAESKALAPSFHNSAPIRGQPPARNGTFVQ